MKQFVDSIHSLLKSDNHNVQRKAMDVLNNRLMTESTQQLEFGLFRDFVKPLVSIIKPLAKSPTDIQITNGIAAMFSLKLLTSKFAKYKDDEWIEKLLDALNLIMPLLAKRYTYSSLPNGCMNGIANNHSHHKTDEPLPPNLLASSMLCATGLSISVGHDSLTYLSSLVSTVLLNMDSR